MSFDYGDIVRIKPFTVGKADYAFCIGSLLAFVTGKLAADHFRGVEIICIEIPQSLNMEHWSEIEKTYYTFNHRYAATHFSSLYITIPAYNLELA